MVGLRMGCVEIVDEWFGENQSRRAHDKLNVSYVSLPLLVPLSFIHVNAV